MVERNPFTQPHPVLVERWLDRLAKQGLRLQQVESKGQLTPAATGFSIGLGSPLPSIGTVSTVQRP